MIEAIKDNWWNKVADPLPPPPPPPPEPVYGWRGIDKFCIQDTGENTGESMYDNLEEYDVDTLASTGNVKDNVIGDPDYIAPTQDEATCPITVYGWEGYQPYCITEEYTLPPDPEPEPEPEPVEVITEETRINIYFDSSGSMTGVLTGLNAMRDGALMNKLLPYYGDNEAKYKEYVNVYSFDSERFLIKLSDGLNPNDRTINMVFQNEAGRQSTFFNIERGYHDSNCNFSAYSGRLDGYDDDMKTFNARINNYNKPYNGIMFQVASGACEGFKGLIEAMFNGIGNYTGSNGVSTRENMVAKYDVDNQGTADYFSDKVIEAINDVGFNIT